MLKQYSRLFLTFSVIAAAAAAHLIATMNFGYSKVVAPIYSADSDLSVGQASGVDGLSVGYSNPGKLGVGLPDESEKQSTNAQSVQAPADNSLGQPAPPDHSNSVINGQNGIPNTATENREVPLPNYDLRLPSPKLDAPASTLRQAL